MKNKLKGLIAILLILFGLGGQVFYNAYLTPYVFSKSVVKVKVDSGQVILPKNHLLTEEDLYLSQVATKDIPSNAIYSINDALEKHINLSLTDGQILTQYMIDTDHLTPGENETIFPLPKEIIFAINGSLRGRDKVDILLTKEPVPYRNETVEVEDEVLSDYKLEAHGLLQGIEVVHVRSDDNNDVFDTDFGNTTMRTTSTGRVSSAEVRVSSEQRELLRTKIEDGYKLWIARVE